MHISLLVLGLMLTAGGFITVGFGIPINAFSLGNTLIIAGTVSVTGGLVLIGLASAVRQLSRIAEALHGTKPLPARVSRQAEAAVEAALTPPPAKTPPASAPQPPAAPMPAPSPVPTRAVQRPSEPPMRAPEPPRMGDPRFGEPRVAEPRMNEPRVEPRAPIEPRFQAAAPSKEPAPRGPLDWLRPKSKASGPSEPPVVELGDEEAPLSPRSPRMPSPLATMAEPVQEPRAWAPRAEEAMGPRIEPRSEMRSGGPRADRIARSPQDETARREPPVRDKRLFDAMWPEAKAGRAAEALKADEAKPSEATPQAQTGTSENGASESRAAESKISDAKGENIQPIDAASSETKLSETKPMDAGSPDDKQASQTEALPKSSDEPRIVPASERPIAILKSGVIDGMAYTLYADGSIEADLAQGKVKFGSVDALRAHLEKTA